MSGATSRKPAAGAAGPRGGHRAGQSVADAVALEIETRIKTQQLAIGQRIGTKQDLCAEFGVAPATLSEALRLLRARGLVQVRPGPGGGTFVAYQAPLTRLAQTVLDLRDHGATVNDVLGVLDALDEAVISDAAAHRRARDLRELKSLLCSLTKVWRDPVEGPSVNWRLHRRIAEITPNAVLRAFYLNLVDYIESEGRQEAQPLAYLSSSDERLQIHHDIVEAIESQDQDAAREVALRHRSG